MNQDSLPSLVHRYRAARQDRSRVVLEGFHAVKHALRFSACLLHAATPDLEAARELARHLAPDIEPRLPEVLVEVAPDWFRQLAPTPPRTGVIAVAERPGITDEDILGSPRSAPILLLEGPSDAGNLGAAVRVAASAGAAGVLVSGERDPYDPVAVRGSAGLHFALPVATTLADRGFDRPLIAADPEGEELDPATLPARCVLALGTERDGLSDALRARADRRVRIPMEPKVSSLNLAASAAILLYAWRLRR